ncbi:hypothetical protein [Clostridium sp.]|uniref:hypothetical protein n=1 Tax=Clostridium sp. TaxID=1506 RepID=UPI003216F7EA
MSKKRIFIVLLIMGISVSLMGCEKMGDKAVVVQTDINKEDGKATVDKIVVEEDVTQKVENIAKVTVEDVDLKLDSLECFYPGFYLDGKLYGAVSKGGTYFVKEHIEGSSPIDGGMEENLYSLNNENILEKTNKEIFTWINGVKTTNYKWEEGRLKGIYTIDYRNEDVPREACDMENEINKITHIKMDAIKEVSGSDEYYYFSSANSTGYGPKYLGIYDEKNKEAYKMDIGKEDRFSIFYIKETDSLMVWDINNGLINKVTLKDGKIILEKYMDLEEIVGEKEVYLRVISDSEIIMQCDIDINEYEDNYPIYKTNKISKYNFKTNEYKVIFEGAKEKNMLVQYVSGNLFLAEEFEQKSDKAENENRYIMKLDSEELKVIFKEDIRGETQIEDGGMPTGTAIVNEAGNEIFLSKRIYGEFGVSDESICKRYIIEN